MTIAKVDVEKPMAAVHSAALMLSAVHGEEVVQGTARDAAIGKPLRAMERAASLLDAAASSIRDQVLQLRDGWPE